MFPSSSLIIIILSVDSQFHGLINSQRWLRFQTIQQILFIIRLLTVMKIIITITFIIMISTRSDTVCKLVLILIIVIGNNDIKFYFEELTS